MKKIILLLLLVVTTLNLNACVVAGLAAAAGYIASESDNHDAQYQKVNLEREKAGLRPLTKNEWNKALPAGTDAKKGKK